ncbi:hypothetical protein NXS08_03375 [Gleimia sp. 6138-11-ORH1]|uniref:hypothetical protein n=1 Tax=Gleimia sp. 6138-11-ORH1 TaxID=2973937 RepID=UPI002166CCDF|nr:hypothetical protein [Gleimia sp. 6138-11-ORH1]MCS4484527.1 hypothetical protein [Gleimia sp. 6138-11-ORH1]
MNPFSLTDYYHRDINPNYRWLTVGVIFLIIQGYLLFNDTPPTKPAAWVLTLNQYLTPLPGVTSPAETGFDLIFHFTGFALITMALLLSHLRPGFVLLTLGTYAWVTEIIQDRLLYYRTGSYLDALADLAGILFSFIIFYFFYHRKL